MATITIDLDDDLARHVEESARREQKSVSEWVKERVQPQADRAGILADMEAQGAREWLSTGLDRTLRIPGGRREFCRSRPQRHSFHDRFGIRLGASRGLVPGHQYHCLLPAG